MNDIEKSFQPTDYKKNFVDNIIFFLEQTKWSKTRLAAESNCSATYICNMVKYEENPTIDIMINISNAFEQDYADMIKPLSVTMAKYANHQQPITTN